MMRATVARHRRVLVVLLTLFVGVFGSITLASNLGAQNGSQGCSGDIVIQTGGPLFGGTANRLYSNTLLPDRVTSRTYGIDTVPAGTYQVMAVGYDGYVGRVHAFQGNEQWFAEFTGAAGLLDTTGTTGDVPDGLEEAFWSGGVGTVTLASDATQLTARHAFLTNEVANSVEPVCLGLTDVTPPTDSTTTSNTIESTSTMQTTTTVGTTTTSTEPPGTVPATTAPPPPPPATNPPGTSPPATVSPAGTDSPETQVLGAVEEAGVATAVAAQPSFTG